MKPESLEDKMIAWVQNYVQNYGIEMVQVNADSDLIMDGVVDSIGFVEFMKYVEEETGVKIDITDALLDDITTINRLCQHLSGLKEEAR